MDDQVLVAEIAEFRNLIEHELQLFLNASQHLGEQIVALANMVLRAFNHQLNFITQGIYMDRPDDEAFRGMMELMSREIGNITSLRNQNRIEAVVNHIATISESIMALSWITLNTPIQFIRDMRDAGQYYGNRVLSQNKGNQVHVDWINRWNEVLQALEDYVREYHRTGFEWNVAHRIHAHRGPRGDADVSLRGPVPPRGPGGDADALLRGPPPPPPPPPAMDIGTGGDDRQNLLRDLNQGVDIVRMLRPVNREQPSQSQQSSPSTSGGNLPRTAVAERTYPPKLLLDGRKWRVEHQKDRYDLVIDGAEMSQSLAMFKCQNGGLEVRSKLNGVTIDNCKRFCIVLKDIISSVELIRCQHVKVQCTGHVPLISIDNCDSVEIYLTDKSLDAEMISSKSSSLNVSLMKPDGDCVEMPVPEQIKSIVVEGRLVSSVVEKI